MVRIVMASMLLSVVGCGGSIVPVSGRVTLEGKPLANATVVFEPVSDTVKPGPGSIGKTDVSGSFQLQLMTAETKGAIIGKHVVRITAYDGDDTVIPSSGKDMSPFRKAIIADEFNVVSKLTFDVPAGGTRNADFEVKRPNDR